MQIRGTWMTAFGLVTIITANPLNTKRILFTAGQCTDEKKLRTIHDEIPFVHAIASAAAAQVNANNDYIKNFFFEPFVQGPASANFFRSMTGVYNKIAGVAETLDFSIPITCVNDDVCQSSSVPIAYVDEDETKLNLCDKWFDDGHNTATSAMISQCHQNGAAACTPLEKLKSIRCDIVMKDISLAGRAADYTYGVNDCLELKRTGFDRSKATYADPENPVCKNSEGKEGFCQPLNSIVNADSIMFVALGVYFSLDIACNGPISITVPAQSKAKYARDASCPLLSFVPDNVGVLDSYPAQNSVSLQSIMSSLQVEATMSSIPPAPTTTPTPTPTQGVNSLYPILTTVVDPMSQTWVYECQSSTTDFYPGAANGFVDCAGDKKTLSGPPSKPSVSVTVGTNQVLLGSMTGEEFYTSISNVLEKLAPTLTSGNSMVSNTAMKATQTISKLSWVNTEKELKEDGELLVSLDAVSYSDAGIRSALIKAAASAFQNSATNSSCFMADWEDVEPRSAPLQLNATFCNAANFAGVTYYPPQPFGSPPNNTQFLLPHIDWAEKAGSFECKNIIRWIEIGLAVLGPEFVGPDVEISSVIEAGCELAGQ